MSLIGMTGFESGDINTHSIVSWGTVPPTLTVEALNPRTGAYVLRVNKAAGAAGGSGRVIEYAIASTAEIYLSFGVRFVTWPTSTLVLFATLDCPTTKHLSFVIGNWGGLGSIRVSRYRTYDAALGATFDSAALDTWYRFSGYFKIADAGGRSQWWIDGNPVADFTGDTRNAGTAEITKVRFGGGVDGIVSTPYQTLIDDIVICTPAGSVNNGVPGNVRIYGISPTAAGSYSQLTPTVGQNYDCVNEIPPSDADYVYGAVQNGKDSYTLADLVGVTGAIRGIQHMMRAQESAADGNAVARLLRLAGNDYQGVDRTIGASWAYFTEILETNPLLADQWAIGAINALEAGQVVR